MSPPRPTVHVVGFVEGIGGAELARLRAGRRSASAPSCCSRTRSSAAISSRVSRRSGSCRAGTRSHPLALETSLPGVFAAGEVRHGSTKRVAGAVGDGAMAVTLAYRRLDELHREA